MRVDYVATLAFALFLALAFALHTPTGFVVFEGANCSNGIQDGNETGIDCGGSCSACSLTLTPGPGWNGNTSQPSPMGLPGQPGYDAKAIARWDVVPYQTFNGTFNVGVIAFHMNGIEKVSFSVNNGSWVDVQGMSFNPESGIREYWATLDASTFAQDGPIEVRAIVYPKVGIPRVLQGPIPNSRGTHSLFLFTNAQGSLTAPTIYVSAAGSDTNSGTVDAPKANIATAASAIGDGGTIIILQPGIYNVSGIYRPDIKRYITIRPAHGLSRDEVIIKGPSGNRTLSRTMRLHWQNLTFDDTDSRYDINSFATQGNETVWFDGVRFISYDLPDANGVISSGGISGNEDAVYLTDVIRDRGYRGFEGIPFARRVKVKNVQQDAFVNVGLLVDSSAHDIITPTGPGLDIHSDTYQAYAGRENEIIYGYNTWNTANSGMMNKGDQTDPGELAFENCAYVNILFNKTGTLPTATQLTGSHSHVLLQNITWLNQTIALRDDLTGINTFTARNVIVRDTILERVSYNRYVALTGFGAGIPTGVTFIRARNGTTGTISSSGELVNWFGEASCSNNIQDGNETGIDCGGSCTACSSGNVLIPGAGWNGNITQPAAVGNPNSAGYNAKAIARWNVVPFQTITAPINIGIVAFHSYGIKNVSFSLNNGPWITVKEMTLNPQTGTVEYWTTIDPAQIPADTLLDVRAIVYPHVGVPRVLQGPITNSNVQGARGEQSLFLNVNRTQTPLTFYVSPSGSDALGNGSKERPYATILHAARHWVRVGNSRGLNDATIYLAAGNYTITSDPYPHDSNLPVGWLTITPEPGIPRSAVTVTSSNVTGLQMRLLRWKNITATVTTTSPFNAPNGGGPYYLWIDGCNLSGPGRMTGANWMQGINPYAGIYITDTQASGTSDGIWHANIIRNVTINDIASDTFRGGVKMIINTKVWGVQSRATGNNLFSTNTTWVRPDGYSPIPHDTVYPLIISGNGWTNGTYRIIAVRDGQWQLNASPAAVGTQGAFWILDTQAHPDIYQWLGGTNENVIFYGLDAELYGMGQGISSGSPGQTSPLYDIAIINTTVTSSVAANGIGDWNVFYLGNNVTHFFINNSKFVGGAYWWYPWTIGLIPKDIIIENTPFLNNRYTNFALPLEGVTVRTAACSNGIQDGNETGIDCGGSCISCGVCASGFARNITQYNITWTFDKCHQMGQFINGDYWVVGPVNVTNITPSPVYGLTFFDATGNERSCNTDSECAVNRPQLRGFNYSYACVRINPDNWGSPKHCQYHLARNGYEVNPRVNTHHYNSRASGYNITPMPSLPVVLKVNSSLISSISQPEEKDVGCPKGWRISSPIYGAGGCNDLYLRSASVLTVLHTPPSPTSLRPPFIGNQKPLYDMATARTDLLTNLLPAPGMPPVNESIRQLQRVRLDYIVGWTSSYIIPMDNHVPYGADFASEYGEAALQLMTNIPNKEKLLAPLLQLGIDLHYIAKNGGYWPADGGHASGRKFPILFTGLMLGDRDMLAVGNLTLNISLYDGIETEGFGEDCQTYYDDNATRPVYLGIKGMPRWGISQCRNPAGNNPSMFNESNPYRQISSNVWVGPVLAARMLGLEREWNHQPYFDYTDRWMDEKLPGAHGSVWSNAMWLKYRDNATVIDTCNNGVQDRCSIFCNATAGIMLGETGIDCGGNCGACASGRILVPGTGWHGNIEQPSNMGRPSDPGYNATAIARWDVVPNQGFSGTHNVGVVAFHMEGIKSVAFSLDGGPWLEIQDMTYNPQSRVVEYWATINGSAYTTPTILQVRAIAYPRVGKPRILPPLILTVYPDGYARQVRWVAPWGNNTAGNGSQAKPFATIKQAAKSIEAAQGGKADYGLIYLAEGDYNFSGSWEGASWIKPQTNNVSVTISGAPGANQSKVRITGGGSGDRLDASLIHLTNMTVVAGLVSSNNLNRDPELWFDNVLLTKYNKWIGGFENGFTTYLTDVHIKDTNNGVAGAELYRHVKVENIVSDAFQNLRIVINGSVNGINKTGWEQYYSQSPHPDVAQWHGTGGVTVFENRIIYGLRSSNVIQSQGIFMSDGYMGKDIAIVNAEVQGGSQWGLHGDHVVFWHNTFLGGWNWRGNGHFSSGNITRVSMRNNVFTEISGISGPESPEILFDNNHFVVTTSYGANTRGSNMTNGDPGLGADGRPINGSILRGRVREILVPIDAAGNSISLGGAIGALQPLDISCTDSIQNGMETGIDCGGNCGACKSIYYIRDGANGTGTDWDNAFARIPDVLRRGATYYIADGNYGGVIFDDPVNESAYIIIRKATLQDHGTESGWKAAYGDGVANFSGITFANSYYIFDGVTGGGQSQWDSGHGFVITRTGTLCRNNGNLITINNAPSHIRISHVHAYAEDATYPMRGVYGVSGGKSLTFSHNYIHNIFGPAYYISGWNDSIIEHSLIKDVRSTGHTDPFCPDMHAEGVSSIGANTNITFRYSLWDNISGTAVFAGVNNGIATDWKIYGNIFSRSVNTIYYYYSGNDLQIMNGLAFYNNNIVNGNTGTIIIMNGTGNKAYNNIWYNNRGNTFYFFNTEHDYNLYSGNYRIVNGIPVEKNTEGAQGESHAQIINSSPFVDNNIDPLAADFRLIQPTAPGLNLTYNVDISGRSRGSDGNWDRGAYEYVFIPTCTDKDSDGIFDYNSTACPLGKDICPGTTDDYLRNNTHLQNSLQPIGSGITFGNVTDSALKISHNSANVSISSSMRLVRINESGCFERLNFTQESFIKIEDKKNLHQLHLFPADQQASDHHLHQHHVQQSANVA